MDYNDEDTSEPWNWQGQEFCFEKHSNSGGMWNEVTLNEEDLSYVFDDSTPVKACGDLAYHVTQSDNVSKEPEHRRETCSQVKRRRMLQFDAPAVESSLCSEEMSSTFLKSNERVDSLEEAIPEVSQWVSGFSDNASASSFEGLDPSCDGWLAACFNDADMNFGPEDMNFSEASDVQIDVGEFCNAPLEFEANVVQRRLNHTSGNIVFKGRKSFIRTPTKMASSVAYPFAFIKPCAVHGDVTLKDINQRIRTPPPSKSKQNSEDPAAFPTSAFSGKPVVGKTKIRTEGGKGSITIMRTKG